MNTNLIRNSLRIAALLACCATILSCASKQELDERLKRRNERYGDRQDRQSMRTQARQERTDMWFDRVMGKGPQTETGLKVPQ